MMKFTLTSILALSPLLATATPMPAATQTKTHPNEIFYLTNCFNNKNTAIQYAEFDYYYNSTLSVVGGHAVAPDLKAVINSQTSVDYEDGTWVTLSGAPFTLSVVIGADASTTKAGTKVGTATSSTSSGTMNCVHITRVVPYKTSTVTCYSDYACVDAGAKFPL